MLLVLAGVTRLLPFTAAFGDVPLFGAQVPWWTPLLIVAVIGTAVAYTTGIAASNIFGSRLASFIGLLEVVSASLFAWLVLAERLTAPQFVGGALILGGIAAVRTASSAPHDAPGATDVPDDALPADLTPARV